MTHQYDIRQRNVEISTKLPTEVKVDAMILPWRPLKADEEATGILGQAGEQVLEEIAEYKGEREVMLTSAGDLPARFLFHLTMPGNDEVPSRTLEERLRVDQRRLGLAGDLDHRIVHGLQNSQRTHVQILRHRVGFAGFTDSP